MIDPSYFRLPKLFNKKGFPLNVDDCVFVPDFFPYKESNDEKYTLLEITDALSSIWRNKPVNIVFYLPTEGFVVDYMRNMDHIVRKLTTVYNIPVNNFYFVSGALPIRTNISNYHDICKKHGLLPINLLLKNTFEESMKPAVMDLRDPKSFSNHKNKKFISFNGAPRNFRVHATMLLLEKNLLEYGYFSLYGLNKEPHIIDMKYVYEYVCDPVKFPKTGTRALELLKQYYTKFPMVLTASTVDTKHVDKGDEELFRDAHFNLVMETQFLTPDRYGNNSQAFNFNETVFLTEKTFRSIGFKCPFISLNRPRCMKALKEYGYKTFHPFINEGYDEIGNDEDRMLAVIDEVDRLCKLSDDEWLSIQNDLEPILKYNYEKLINSNPFYLKSYEKIS